VADRYLRHTPPAQAPLTITAPASVTTPTVTVTGTAVPGATVVLAATLSPPGATEPNGTAHSAPIPTNVVSARAGANGAFTATLPSPAGTWVITAATATAAATGYAQATVASSAS
jgi:glucoamylase